MAGKRKSTPGAGRKALRAQLDNVLRAASRLDGIQAGAGEGLCERVAVAMSAEIARSIGTSGPGSQSEPQIRTY